MKKTIEKIFKRQDLTPKELNEFVRGYIKTKKDKDPTAEQVVRIVSMLRQGLFNISYAAKEYANELDLTVVTVENTKKGIIERIDVYD